MPPSSSKEEKSQLLTNSFESMSLGIETPSKHRRPRRYRKKKVRSEEDYDSDADTNQLVTPVKKSLFQGKERRSQKNKGKKKELPNKDDDPYDSDPGESYREHCMRFQGDFGKSCLRFPRRRNRDSDSIVTAPPSPAGSEFEDVLSMTPPSLGEEVRYSLRSSIGDGSEKQPGGPTVMERRELRPNGVPFNVSHWSDSGKRAYMEDRYVIEDLGPIEMEVMVSGPSMDAFTEGLEVSNQIKQHARRIQVPVTWFGVFDGHGGERASQFCADWLSSYVKQQKSYPSDIGHSMKSALVSIDQDFCNTGYPDGSTACTVALIGGHKLVCANAGDSRAIVVRKDGSVVRLSRDHKPGVPEETRRITDLGGRVIYWGRWRVEGLLAVSRSVGDASLKPYITAEPDVCDYEITELDQFLILSSDGVWDVMENEEVAQLALASACYIHDDQVHTDEERFKSTAQRICEHASSCGSTDNFGTICVDLQSYYQQQTGYR